MKTVRRTDGRVQRCTDEEAEHLVKTTGAVYVPKSTWKEQEKRDDK